jgi:hypothetical protein
MKVIRRVAFLLALVSLTTAGCYVVPAPPPPAPGFSPPPPPRVLATPQCRWAYGHGWYGWGWYGSGSGC